MRRYFIFDEKNSMKQISLQLLYNILFIINIVLFGFLFFDNIYFTEDNEIFHFIIIIFILLKHKIYNFIVKTKIFILNSLVSSVIGLILLYLNSNIIVDIENHGYIFFCLFVIFLIYIDYINIKENGPNVKSY